MSTDPTAPPSGNDPRLEIPEILREPAKGPGNGGAEPVTQPSGFVGMGKAWAVSLDFIFTILAGAGLGWLVDRWQGSMPIGTLVGLGLGFASALLRIVRSTMREERAAEARRKSGGR